MVPRNPPGSCVVSGLCNTYRGLASCVFMVYGFLLASLTKDAGLVFYFGSASEVGACSMLPIYWTVEPPVPRRAYVF